LETELQVQFLQAHACDEAQGCYFSKPMIANLFAKLLETTLAPFSAQATVSLHL